MTTLVVTEHVDKKCDNMTLMYLVIGDHQQTVIDFAVNNEGNCVHEKDYEILKKECGFMFFDLVADSITHYHGKIDDVVRITVLECDESNCDYCYPPVNHSVKNL